MKNTKIHPTIIILSNCVRFTWKYCASDNKFEHIDFLRTIIIIIIMVRARAREYHRQLTRYKNPFLLRVYNLLIALEFDSDRAHNKRIFLENPFSALLVNHFVGTIIVSHNRCRFTIWFEGLHIIVLGARVLHIMRVYICRPWVYRDRKPLLLRQEFNSNCSKF